MKTSRLITLDIRIAEKLGRIENVSGLINELLGDYFRVRVEKNSLFDQKKALIGDLKKKQKLLRRKLRLWKILKPFYWIISVLFGWRGYGKIENHLNNQSKITLQDEDYKSP